MRKSIRSKSLIEFKYITFAYLLNGKKVVDKAISGFGSNRVKCRCFTKDEIKRCQQIGVTGHAETTLLKRYLRKKELNKKKIKKNKYTLVVVRITSKGNLALAKPCNLCVPIIKMANIRHVWYSGDNEWIYTNSRDLKGEPSSGTARLLSKK